MRETKDFEIIESKQIVSKCVKKNHSFLYNLKDLKATTINDQKWQINDILNIYLGLINIMPLKKI